MEQASDERLQNMLAKRGVASRRGAATLIEEGRVSVDGRVVTIPGQRVAIDAKITVNGRPIAAQAEEMHTFLYNKPMGEICSTEGQGGRTVLEVFRKLHLRLVPVGRLDKESEGLLLISNDGNLINKLTHPRYNHKKIYDVDVNIPPTPQQLTQLRTPMVLEGYRIRPVPVTQLDGVHLRFTLSEGRHRQIRLMCEEVGLNVNRLKRIALGKLQLNGLEPGEYRELSAKEVSDLLRVANN